MPTSKIKVLLLNKMFNLPEYEVRFLANMSGVMETIATFKPDVVISPTNASPGALNLASFEIQKICCGVDPNATDQDVINVIEGTYKFNLYNTHPNQHLRPLTSIYTPTYNTGDFLKDTYESLRAQTCPDWEWVVIDDHSTDRTWEKLEQYAKEDWRVRPFKSGYNISKIGGTKDVATRLSNGKYLIELDHDDMLTDTAVEEVKNAFESDSNIGMVYTNYAGFFENGGNHRFPSDWSYPWNAPDRYRETKYRGKTYLECRGPDIYDRFGPNYWQVFGWFLTVGPNHIRAFRKEIFDKLGGYNYKLPVADDWDLMARFFTESKVHHIDKMLYLYRFRDGYENATFTRNKSIQDHMEIARAQYVTQFERKNRELLESKEPFTPKKVSYIVLDATGNENKYVKNCISSIRTFAPSSEIILIGNGVKSKAEKRADKYIQTEANIGFGAGCNLGANHATGDILCFINDDAKLTNESTFVNMLRLADNNIVGCYSNNAKPPQQVESDKTKTEDLYMPMVVGLCMMVKKKTFMALNGFDTRFLTFEDDDFCLRAKKQLNIDSVIAGGSYVEHANHKTFEAKKMDVNKVMVENKARFAKKHPKLKVIVIAKDESLALPGFHEQFKGITNDFCLLDTGSTDKTVIEARRLGFKVLDSERPFDFATARNEALDRFAGDAEWVIMIDPDERINPEAIAAIPELLVNASHDIYLSMLQAVYPNGETRNFVAKPFLFRNTPDIHWIFRVHEKLIGSHKQALVTNAMNSHIIALHEDGRRQKVEGFYSNLMSQEPYHTDEAYRCRMKEEWPILDYERLDDPRLDKIQIGPLVSVIIPTYNRPELLKSAIQSALNQTYVNIEVVVVGDNCPTLEKIEPQSNLRSLNLPKNHGEGGAVPRNVGIQLAQGEYIAYLDDDNTWYPNHVASIMQGIQDKKTAWGFSSMSVKGKDLQFTEPKFQGIDTSCVIHPKSFFYKYGPWKNRIEGGYAHDWEFINRFSKEPWVCTKLPTLNYNAESSGQESFLLKKIDKPALLNIGILGLIARTEMRDQLVTELNKQINELKDPNSVTVSVNTDNGESPTGTKRQQIIDATTAEYVCFIDDDDWVAPNYIKDIVNALTTKPDCVTFKGLITSNGEEFKFSLDYPQNVWCQDEKGTHMRCPASLCPIKTEIAKKTRFKDIYCAEDRIWAIEIWPYLYTEVFIDKHLYFYRANSNITESQKEEKIKQSRAIIDQYKYVPFVKNRASKNMNNVYVNLFKTNPSYGNHDSDLFRYNFVLETIECFKCDSLVDISSGRGNLLKLLPNNIKPTSTDIEKFHNYNCEFLKLDLTRIEKDMFLNRKWDALSCLDVLEHIPLEHIDNVLQFLSSCAKIFCFSIANHSDCINGTELHLIRENEEWWSQKLSSYFSIQSKKTLFDNKLYQFILFPKDKNV